MKFLFIVITVIFFTAACNRGDRVPSGIVARDKMEDILWDMLRADQFLTDFVFNKDSTLNKREESTKKYSQVLALHKISKEEFKKSFLYYQDHPDQMKMLMDSISKRKIEIPSTEPLPVKVINDDESKKLVDTSAKQKPVISNGN